jgi:cytochrome c oxidase subunit II
MKSPRALALPVVAGVAAAAATFAIVTAVEAGDQREGAGHAAGPGQARTSASGHASGRLLFFQMGCASCHSLAAAGSTGAIGPNLDERLRAHNAKSLKATILHPPGSGPGLFSVMPDNFGERMNDRALDALVGFLLAARRP